MDEIKNISIEEYDYKLDDQLIAKYPLEKRDASKLLLLKGSVISESRFTKLAEHLPANTLLITNETKVIKARLLFFKPGGVKIEVFCLEPVNEAVVAGSQMASGSPVQWRCFVGNSKRWKSGILTMQLSNADKKVNLSALRVSKEEDHSIVEFSWDDNTLNFGDLLLIAGELPLPPYLHRKAEAEDLDRYQTVFANNEGSVAAPTAGLHFTEELLNKLKNNAIDFAKVTLHVGAGTFKPVSAEIIGEHSMHAEKIFVEKKTIKQLIHYTGKQLIPVGTTSMRTVESLFWIGVSLLENPDGQKTFRVSQWEPYEKPHAAHTEAGQALQAIINYLESNNLNGITASTSLMIVPGYRFRLATGLITNFHQPKSTLLLLVAALIGPKWKEAYAYALAHDFRFLSYGDGCLFLPE